MNRKFCTKTKTRTEILQEMHSKYTVHSHTWPTNFVFTKAKGIYLYDDDGNRYFDCYAAASVVSHGHCHPKIRNAMLE